MTAYYNEHDREAAAWLRELIKAGLIAPGEVDETDIQKISSRDLAKYTQVHLFAGIGGWSYALRLAGWPDDRPVWTGSCPCQPFSAAGKQKGTKDARHLWPWMRHLMFRQRPAIAFGEQVASRLGREWLAGVRDNLETLGYAVGAADLCAASVAAPHIRQRLFWVADSRHDLQPGTRQRRRLEAAKRREPSIDAQSSGLAGRLADTKRQRGRPRIIERTRIQTGVDCWLGEPVEPRLEGLAGHGDNRSESGRLAAKSSRSIAAAGAACGLADSGIESSERGTRSIPRTKTKVGGERPQHGNLSDGSANGSEARPRGQQPQDGGLGFWSDFDLIPCRDDKVRRIEPGSFPLAHGVPFRVGLLRGYGNAIVPEVAAEFIKAYLQTRPSF